MQNHISTPTLLPMFSTRGLPCSLSAPWLCTHCTSPQTLFTLLPVCPSLLTFPDSDQLLSPPEYFSALPITYQVWLRWCFLGNPKALCTSHYFIIYHTYLSTYLHVHILYILSYIVSSPMIPDPWYSVSTVSITVPETCRCSVSICWINACRVKEL